MITEPAPGEGLTALGRRIATERPDLEIRDGERTMRAAEMPARWEAVAAGLQRLGVRAGDHVGIWMRNRLEWLDAWFAVAHLGAVIVPLNTRFSLAEADYVLRHGNVSWLIWRPGDGAALDADALARLAEDGLELRGRVVLDGDPAGSNEVSYDALLAGTGSEPVACAERPAALGMIQYTSGSTAFPKGAMLRNEALVRNAHGLGRAWRYTEDDVVLCSNPLFHCGGSVFAFLAGLAHGSSQVLMGAWKVETAAELIDEHGVTTLPVIDAALRDVVAHAHATGHPFSSVRLVSTAADRGLFERAVDLLGCEVSNIYGLTECHPNVCVGDLSDPLADRLDHIGRPQHGLELVLGDPETGEHPIEGPVGEILIRGWGVMNGYYNDPAATERTLLADGFLRTGDLGRIDDRGFVDYVGRAKLMIKSGGENIAIEEIETALRHHPGVADVVVVPVPHERFGEVGYAYLRAHAGETLDADEVMTAARDHVAGFKLPKHTEVVDDLPRTGSGKVDRVSLTTRARERVQPVSAAPAGSDAAS